MRTTFIRTLIERAEVDRRLWLLTGDLGFSVLEAFAERFPDRYINVGVAEQNMIGVASGLALSGYTVFCYSIVNFATLRCYEQIRNDVCYHGANVKIVGIGGGLSYSTAGYTHHALEDLAAMRALPGMTVVAPGDTVEAREATRLLAATAGPAYLRLDRGSTPIHRQDGFTLHPGRAVPVRAGLDGEQVLLLSIGGMLEETLATADRLKALGIAAGVASVPFLKPFDRSFVEDAARRVRLICTIEEHSAYGGLADEVAQTLARLDGPRAALLPFNLGDAGTKGLVGSQASLRRHVGLDHDGMAAAIADRLVARAAEEAGR
jgi:transketolase